MIRAYSEPLDQKDDSRRAAPSLPRRVCVRVCVCVDFFSHLLLLLGQPLGDHGHCDFLRCLEGAGTTTSVPSRVWTNKSSARMRSFWTPEGAM